MGDCVTVFLFILSMATYKGAAALECFSCMNATDISSCHLTKDCGQGENPSTYDWFPAPSYLEGAGNQSFALGHWRVCFTEVVGSGQGAMYNLGCRQVSKCGNAGSMDSIVGRSIEPRSTCNHCCGLSYCNKNLCVESGGSPTVCHDDPMYNCALVASSFDICSDVDHAKTVCKKHCELCSLIDGNWSPWTAWSQCDASCSMGLKLRMRTCTNPSPSNGGSDCVGETMQTGNCTFGPCPVNGAWSSWAPWSQCDRSCDLGQKLRLRFCNSPSPVNGGKDCPGDAMEIGNCTLKNCPVDGGWTDWSNWSNCDKTCGAAQRMRMRSCSKPAPAYGGKNCDGNQMEIGECPNVPTHCPVDGGWSAWSTLSDCSTSCGAGLHHRNRNCSNPIPAYNGKPCFGDAQEYKVCVQKACSDGGWSPWSQWSNCSRSCDGGLMSRVRSCDNPHASTYGKQCEGQDSEYVTCNRQNCPVQSVFFTVDKPSDLTGFNNGPLALNNIITNEGNGYNIKTGNFTTPVSGIYHVTLTASTDHRTNCHLLHNNEAIVNIHTSSNERSASAYVQLASRDILNVICDGGMQNVGSGNVRISGALVTRI